MYTHKRKITLTFQELDHFSQLISSHFNVFSPYSYCWQILPPASEVGQYHPQSQLCNAFLTSYPKQLANSSPI